MNRALTVALILAGLTVLAGNAGDGSCGGGVKTAQQLCQDTDGTWGGLDARAGIYIRGLPAGTQAIISRNKIHAAGGKPVYGIRNSNEGPCNLTLEENEFDSTITTPTWDDYRGGPGMD